jgi:hypothetical protein
MVISLLLPMMVVALSSSISFAQNSFTISKKSDFSTEDRIFSQEDTLFMKVVAPDVDFTNIDENNFELEAEQGEGEFETVFTNLLNGIYTVRVPLQILNSSAERWRLEARIRDDSGQEFRTKVEIAILGLMRQDEVEIKGIVEDLGIDNLTVSGVTILVNSATLIFDDKENPISLSDLSVGQLVEVKANRQSDGMLLAIQIKVTDEDQDEDEIEITGEITELGDNQIVVLGFTFTVNENTVILDDKDNAISFADLRLGFLVEVKATVQSDSSLLASQIKIEDRLKDEIEFTGLIEALTDTSLVVNGLTFSVDQNTQVLDDDENPISLADLQVGLKVEIRAEILVDGTRLATRIKIEDRDEDEIELTGTIDSLGMNNLTVANITFFVDQATQILDNKKNPINFSDLMVGQIVEVKGVRQPDGTFLATKIQIEDRIEDEVEIKGTIESLTDTTITVSGLTFRVTENTAVLDSNKNPIAFSDLSIGLFVEVRGELLPGGTLVAIRIRIEDNNQNELEVKGPIDSLRTSNLFVLGINFQVDSNTQILDKKGIPINFSDLMVGQFVEIRALRQPDGSNLATRIKLEDVSVISGAISNVQTNSISIFDSNLLTNDNTLVLGAQNLTLSLSDLSSGQIVEARTTSLADGSKLATKIRVLNAGVVTTVGNSKEETFAPRDFALEQNYPNPFNPTTTLSFRISGSGNAALKVNLVIYNLLGQTVRTLVDEPLRPGAYSYQWDGRDDFGNQLPSGIYLYRLKAGQVAQTRRMAFIK